MAGRMPFSSSMPDMFDPYAAIRPAYMRRPVQRPAAYYFLKTILIAGGIAGGLIALYRNDVFLELSRRVGQESRYFELERYLGVTPGWGTPRSMQPVLEGGQVSAEQPVAALAPAAAERPVAAPTAEAATTPTGVDATADLRANAAPEPTSNVPVAAVTAESPPAAPVAAAPVAAAAPAETAKPAFDPLAPVSLDSLPLLPRGARAPAAASPAVEAAPVAVTRAASPSKPRAAAVSLDEPADEPAPKRSRKAREAEPEPAPVAKAPKAKPEPKGPSTAPNPHDNPLTASIRAAVRARPAKSTVD